MCARFRTLHVIYIVVHSVILVDRYARTDVYVGLVNGGRKAAVQVVRPGIGEREREREKERQNEANILVQLEHANIVSFMVMILILTGTQRLCDKAK